LVLIGDGNKQVDAVYIDNAAKAHLLALDAGAKVGGKAYFITNGQPLAMRELINDILAAADLPAVTKSVSPGAAYAIASIMENAYRLFRIKREPLLTRFVVRQLATSHWYDISAAQRDLGYEPTITMEQGMQRLRSWLQEGLRHD
jgi:nucleoside-diphosphate-sugar epimerase